MAAPKYFYDILFVRHGVSCANAYDKSGLKTTEKYKDPELSAYGIEFSRANNEALKGIIATTFEGNPYRVNASCMIRTQETAYFMLLEGMPDKGMRILPHIGEDVQKQPMPHLPLAAMQQDGNDNIPYPYTTQLGLMKPEVRARIRDDKRTSEGLFAHDPSSPEGRPFRSNWDNFVAWMILQQTNGKIDEYFDRNKSAAGDEKYIRRAVIFTHSMFLGHTFGKWLSNNGVIRVQFSLDGIAVRPDGTLSKHPKLTTTSKLDTDPVKDRIKNIKGCTRPPKAASVASGPLGAGAGEVVVEGLGAAGAGPPVVSAPTETVFDILFVRHGVSCANAWEKTGSPLRYKDPELTDYGIQFSRDMRPNLEQKIRENFGDNPYEVGSSCMIRAQETAYFMLLEGTAKAMTILPHIGEESDRERKKPDFEDNIPFPEDIQRGHSKPKVLASIREDKRRSDGPFLHDPSLTEFRAYRFSFWKFMLWMLLQQENGTLDQYFPRGADGVRRAVIFTHSYFMGTYFGIKPNNNGILRVQFSLDKFRRGGSEGKTLLKVSSNGSMKEDKPKLTITEILKTKPLEAEIAKLNGCHRIPHAGGRQKRHRSRKQSQQKKRKTRRTKHY